MSWPDKATPGMTPTKVSATLSNRREGPLQSPACFTLERVRELQRLLEVLVPGAGWRMIGCGPFDLCGIDRVLEKPLHLSKKARFRKDRGAQRRNGGGAFEAPT